MKLLLTTALFALESLLSQSMHSQTLDQILVEDKRLLHRGYEVIRSYDADKQISRAVIKKGRKVLVRLDQENNTADLTSLGLFAFLGGKEKQLIIQQSYGGAHCCFVWRIYDLYPEFRLIFDSSRYPIGDGMDDALLEDLDGDGIFEFIQNSNKFAYFNGYCFVCLPRPVVVFKYDRSSKQYLPANHLFPSFALRDIKASIEKVKELNREDYSDAFPYVLDVLLSYIYAGMERRGWAFYDRQYGSPGNKSIKRLIKRELRNDGIYRFLYVKRRHN